MRSLTLAILLISIFGCTSVQQSTRLSTNLHAKEYNSIASKYMDRPTSSTVEKMSDGATVLAISIDNYGTTQSSLRFSKKHVTEYLNLINKYLEWEQLAKSREDAFTKEIGRADTWGNGIAGTLSFTFHSGNSSIHFLSVAFCATGTCLDETALYFDTKNAIELKALLKKFESGSIKQKDIDSVYM